MSQSALSAALARLRTLLGDELLVRTGRGMRPTARAADLAGPLASILGQVRDDILQGGAYDPKRTQRLFSICLSDVGSYVLWPAIVRAVRAQAPQIELRLLNLAQPAIEQSLERAEADLAIGAFPALRSSLYQRRLYERTYVCLVRSQHPFAGSSLTLEQFASTPQVVVHTASGIQGNIDESLASRGLTRSHTVSMPSYLLLPPLLESDDCLAVVPEQLADVLVRHWNLVTLKLPMPLPTSTIRLYWHRRFHEDAGNIWLRQLIVAEFGSKIGSL